MGDELQILTAGVGKRRLADQAGGAGRGQPEPVQARIDPAQLAGIQIDFQRQPSGGGPGAEVSPGQAVQGRS
jgi:hypothetical protein